MSDQILGGHNFGDPDTSDPRFNMSNMLSAVAQTQLDDLRHALEDRMVAKLCGPQTLAYYRSLYTIASANLAWGKLPNAPASLDD